MPQNSLEEAYRYFYNQDYVTPKQMANLICGKDPRNGSHKYVNSDFKKTIQRIRDAHKRGEIHFNGELKNDSPIEAKAFFRWAVTTYPDFRNKVPADMIVGRAEVNNAELPEFDIEANVEEIPSSFEKAYWDSRLEIRELKKKIVSLENKVARLSVFEKKKIGKLHNSENGGKASKGKRKNYK